MVRRVRQTARADERGGLARLAGWGRIATGPARGSVAAARVRADGAGDLLALRACAEGGQGLGRPGRGRGRLMSRLPMGCLSLEGHGGAGVASARRPSLSLSLSPSLMGRPRRSLDSEASARKPSLSSSSKAWKGPSSSLSPSCGATRFSETGRRGRAARRGVAGVIRATRGPRSKAHRPGATRFHRLRGVPDDLET